MQSQKRVTFLEDFYPQEKEPARNSRGPFKIERKLDSENRSLPSTRTPLRPLRGILKKTNEFENTAESFLTPFLNKKTVVTDLASTTERPWNVKTSPSKKELDFSESEEFLMTKSNTNLDLRKSTDQTRNSKGTLSSFARMSELQGEEESR